jgi:ribosomal protein RSM22 (predicted rRNA methylase)
LLEAGSGVRWIDVGSGPGTAYWGLAWWARHRSVEAELTGLEQSREFVTLAGELARSVDASIGGQGTSARFESFRARGQSLVEKVAQAKPDVLSFMNSIAELSPDLNERAGWLGGIVDAMAADARRESKARWLVIVEPGSKASSRELLELRDKLRAREDVRVWLPCLSGRPCGALASPGDWCHEEAAVNFPGWMDELGAAAGMRKEAVIFSYLVCSIGVHPETPASWPDTRVVSQLMKEKGRVECFLCTEGGKKRARVLDSRVTAETEPFTQVVRGQLFSDVRLSEKGDVESFAECEAGSVELDATVFPPLR